MQVACVVVRVRVAVLFGAPYRVGTLLSVTLLRLVVVVALVAHAPIEIVDGDSAVDPAGVVVERDGAVYSTGVAIAFSCRSSAAGTASATAAASSPTPSYLSVSTSPIGSLRAGVGLNVVLFPRFSGGEGSDRAAGEVAFLGRAVPGVVWSVAILALFGLVTGGLGSLKLFDLADEGCGGRVAGACGRR